MIKTDRSDLPPGDRRDGIVPDSGSDIAGAVLVALTSRISKARTEMYGIGDGGRPMSRPDAVFRHSDAAGCARQLGYKMAGVEPSDPPTPVDSVNMWWGTVIHDEIEKALGAHGEPGWSTEVVCGHDTPVRTAGHADAVHETDTTRTVVEVKSVGGYAYKLAIGERSAAQGPSWPAIVQGALNATALDADELVILDVAKELVSKGTADKKGIPDVQRGIAAWHYDAETFRPVAEHELKRVAKVADLLAKGEPVPAQISDPEIPTAARIVDPSTGRWQVASKEGAVVDSGTWWGCGYCWFRSHCAAAMAAEKAEAA